MQEVIETKTEIVRDPAITAAIRELKSRIKEMAEYQKNGKTAYSESMSKWAKDGYKYGAPCWCNQSMTATALFVIYGKLRQTKRPHFRTPEAYDKYYSDGTDLGNQRGYAYQRAAESLPEAARKIILGEIEEQKYKARLAEQKRAAEESAKRKAEQEIRDREAAVRAKAARYAKYLELKSEFEK